MMKVLSLCSGGGLGDFGLTLAGMEIVAQVEIDEYCQKILKLRWPDVPKWKDIKTFNIDTLVSQSYNMLTDKQKQEAIVGAKRKDYDEAVRLYEKGLSIGDVADFYGTSRQSMWQVLKLRDCKFRQQLKHGKDNHFYRGTSASDKAQNLLEQALEDNVIHRKFRCEKCSDSGTFKDGRTKIQAHHSDYNKPLDVTWLCQKCHHEWHKRNKPVPRKEIREYEPEGFKAVDLVSGGFP